MSERPDFASFELFAGLDPVAIATALEGLERIESAAGQVFDVLATEALCCLVASGRLALSYSAEEERERTIGMLEEGDLLVRPAVGQGGASARVRCIALEDAELLLVDPDRLAAWAREPRLAVNLVGLLATQIAERELAVAIALEPRVERRLSLKLHQLAERWGRVTPDGIRLDLRLTHQELANMVGAVRESVTIALGRLAEAGEIEVRNRTMLIRRRDDENGG